MRKAVTITVVDEHGDEIAFTSEGPDVTITICHDYDTMPDGESIVQITMEQLKKAVEELS